VVSFATTTICSIQAKSSKNYTLWCNFYLLNILRLTDSCY
jgi:hypothetical protein